MLTIIISFLLSATAVYLVLGVLFTIFFQLKGIAKIDKGVHGSSWGFRIMIIPGCIVLWVVLLRKWVKHT